MRKFLLFVGVGLIITMIFLLIETSNKYGEILIFGGIALGLCACLLSFIDTPKNAKENQDG